ncbi:hypothetical protein ACKKBG_A19945 [Auxenochlorella protothecoides x Auxenochlorella symbiontica]
MAEITLRIKPTTGSPPFEVKTTREATVGDLKTEVARACDSPADLIRLIYKGQVLKDHATVESYGLEHDHVVHMVKSKGPPVNSSSTTAQPAAGAPAGAAPSAGGAIPSAAPFGMEGLPGGAAQADALRAALANPAMQSLLSNPDFMRDMVSNNPMLRRMTEANPQVAQVLNDPAMLQDIVRIMGNPSLMREHTRNMDRAMSNLESMPGGFNALRQVHEQIQPILNAAGHGEEADAGASPADANPFASLFAAPGRGAPATTPAATGGDAGGAVPLPNPWGAPAGAAPGAGAATGGLPPLGMFGGGGDGGGLNEALSAFMRDPAMMAAAQQQMRAMLATPEGRSQFQSMMESHPMAAGLRQNPEMRAALANPDMLAAMMDPANMAAMQQMQEAMQRLSGGPLGSLFGGPTAGAGGMEAMLAGMGGAAGSAVPAPPANPEATYATQLQQLQDMGFYDRETNLRALVASSGNVHAAVERLLASF